MPMLSKIIVPVYDVFNMYAQPGESTEFTQLWKTHFVLGPHGLETVIRLVYLLHEALICRVGNSHWLTPLEWSRLVEVFDLHCRPLLRLLRHFRASTPRHEYDPEGIQDLRQQLSSKIAYFPVSLRLNLAFLCHLSSCMCNYRMPITRTVRSQSCSLIFIETRSTSLSMR